MIAAAALLWRHRATLARRDPPDFDPQGKSSWVLGASITAVELPTAFPYFAAIAAIVGSGLGPVRDLVLLLPVQRLLRAPAAWRSSGSSRSPATGPSRCSPRRGSFLQRHWPAVLAGLALVAGVFVVLLGVTGLAASHSAPGPADPPDAPQWLALTGAARARRHARRRAPMIERAMATTQPDATGVQAEDLQRLLDGRRAESACADPRVLNVSRLHRPGADRRARGA